MNVSLPAFKDSFSKNVLSYINNSYNFAFHSYSCINKAILNIQCFCFPLLVVEMFSKLFFVFFYERFATR